MVSCQFGVCHFKSLGYQLIFLTVASNLYSISYFPASLMGYMNYSGYWCREEGLVMHSH